MRAQQVSTKATSTDSWLAESERSGPRIALERDVMFRIPDRPQLRGSLANISATGMFVRSADLQPAGRTLSFELSLSRRQRLIRGEGEVIWSRRFNLGPELPAGMGIRFLRLDGQSQRLVRTMIGDRCPDALSAEARPSAPFSGLSGSQQQRLHAYAGCAAAKTERGWPRRLHGLLALAARAARRVIAPDAAPAARLSNHLR